MTVQDISSFQSLLEDISIVHVIEGTGPQKPIKREGLENDSNNDVVLQSQKQSQCDVSDAEGVRHSHQILFHENHSEVPSHVDSHQSAGTHKRTGVGTSADPLETQNMSNFCDKSFKDHQTLAEPIIKSLSEDLRSFDDQSKISSDCLKPVTSFSKGFPSRNNTMEDCRVNAPDKNRSMYYQPAVGHHNRMFPEHQNAAENCIRPTSDHPQAFGNYDRLTPKHKELVEIYHEPILRLSQIVERCKNPVLQYQQTTEKQNWPLLKHGQRPEQCNIQRPFCPQNVGPYSIPVPEHQGSMGKCNRSVPKLRPTVRQYNRQMPDYQRSTEQWNNSMLGNVEHLGNINNGSESYQRVIRHIAGNSVRYEEIVQHSKGSPLCYRDSSGLQLTCHRPSAEDRALVSTERVTYSNETGSEGRTSTNEGLHAPEKASSRLQGTFTITKSEPDVPSISNSKEVEEQWKKYSLSESTRSQEKGGNTWSLPVILDISAIDTPRDKENATAQRNESAIRQSGGARARETLAEREKPRKFTSPITTIIKESEEIIDLCDESDEELQIKAETPEPPTDKYIMSQEPCQADSLTSKQDQARYKMCTLEPQSLKDMGFNIYRTGRSCETVESLSGKCVEYDSSGLLQQESVERQTEQEVLRSNISKQTNESNQCRSKDVESRVLLRIASDMVSKTGDKSKNLSVVDNATESTICKEFSGQNMGLETIPCPICLNECEIGEPFTVHIRIQHPTCCPFCFMEFKPESSLQSHISLYHLQSCNNNNQSKIEAHYQSNCLQSNNQARKKEVRKKDKVYAKKVDEVLISLEKDSLCHPASVNWERNVCQHKEEPQNKRATFPSALVSPEITSVQDDKTSKKTATPQPLVTVVQIIDSSDDEALVNECEHKEVNGETSSHNADSTNCNKTSLAGNTENSEDLYGSPEHTVHGKDINYETRISDTENSEKWYGSPEHNTHGIDIKYETPISVTENSEEWFGSSEHDAHDKDIKYVTKISNAEDIEDRYGSPEHNIHGKGTKYEIQISDTESSEDGYRSPEHNAHGKDTEHDIQISDNESSEDNDETWECSTEELMTSDTETDDNIEEPLKENTEYKGSNDEILKRNVESSNENDEILNNSSESRDNNNENQKRNTESSEEKQLKPKCSLCLKVYKNVSVLITHVYKTHNVVHATDFVRKMLQRSQNELLEAKLNSSKQENTHDKTKMYAVVKLHRLNLPPETSNPYGYQRKEGIRNDIVKRKNSTFFSCSVCSKLYASSIDFEHHILSHSIVISKENRETVFPCPICLEMFDTFLILSKHLETTHYRTEPGPQEYISQYKDKNMDKPPYRNRKETEQESVSTIPQQKNSASLVCEVCNKQCASNHGLMIHKGKAHQDRPNSSLKEVQVIDHSSDRVSETNSSTSTQEAKGVAKEEDSFTCPFCYKLHTSLDKIKSHLKNVHKCDPSLVKNELNTRNVLFQSEEEKNGTTGVAFSTRIFCHKCHGIFKNYQDFKIHFAEIHKKFININEQRMSKKYPYQNILKTKVDKEEKPNYVDDEQPKYDADTNKESCQCKTCGKYFKNSQSLSGHNYKYHNENIHYRVFCTLCPKRFTNETWLRLHKAYVHRKRRVSCDTCKRSFKDGRGLAAHDRLYHKKKLKIRFKAITNVESSGRQNKLYTIVRRNSNTKKDLEMSVERNAKGKSKTGTTECSNSDSKFECSVCDKAFPIESSLKKHYTIVHKNKQRKMHKRRKHLNALGKNQWYKNPTHQEDQSNNTDYKCITSKEQKISSVPKSKENIMLPKHASRINNITNLVSETGFKKETGIGKLSVIATKTGLSRKNRNKVACMNCHKVFSSRSLLVKHKFYTLCGRKCDTCRLSFPNRFAYERHCGNVHKLSHFSQSSKLSSKQNAEKVKCHIEIPESTVLENTITDKRTVITDNVTVLTKVESSSVAHEDDIAGKQKNNDAKILPFNKPKGVNCRICGKYLPTRSSYTAHWHSIHKTVDSKSYFCHVCGKKFRRKAFVSKHFMKTHFCEECRQVFVLRLDLLKHIQNEHSSSDRLSENFASTVAISSGMCITTTSDSIAPRKRIYPEDTADQDSNLKGIQKSALVKIVKQESNKEEENSHSEISTKVNDELRTKEEQFFGF